MNFFKSVFADDPDPPNPKSEPESKSPMANEQQQENPDSGSPSKIDSDTATPHDGVWSFGGLIRTLTTKSESVIETYRRDLKEFGSGLRKELKVAQGSLGNVSIVIDEFGNSVLKGTAQIISHGKEAILAADHESDSSDSNYNTTSNQNISGQQKRYSRFDAQVRVIQGDVNTYCEELDDFDDYNKWKSGFVLDDMSEEIERLIEENGAMEYMYKRIVPDTVDHESFWFRYFYRLFKLKQAENLRATLVKRAISREEEDLSWDVEDDDDENVNENESNVVEKANLKQNEDAGSKNSEKVVGEEANVAAKSDLTDNKELSDKASEKIVVESLQGEDEGEKVSKSNVDEDGKRNVAEPSSDNVVKENMGMAKNDEMSKENSGSKLDDKMGKAEPGESSKDSDFSVVSSQPSMPEEEDFSWDEIEDLSSIDEKKVTHAGSPNKADLRKRLSVAEDDEDLSWDIEDEDEPAKT